MNYQAFTDDTLLLMHHAALGALAVDDELNKLGQAPRFRVRGTSDWIEHAAKLEAEMQKRGITFDPIKWSGDAASRSDLADAPSLAGPEGEATLVTESQTGEGAAQLRNRIAAMLRQRFRIVSNEGVM
jgi:hypothetical protein